MGRHTIKNKLGQKKLDIFLMKLFDISSIKKY